MSFNHPNANEQSERNPGNSHSSSNGSGAANASDASRDVLGSGMNFFNPHRIINLNAGPSGPSGRPGTNGVASGFARNGNGSSARPNVMAAVNRDSQNNNLWGSLLFGSGFAYSSASSSPSGSSGPTGQNGVAASALEIPVRSSSNGYDAASASERNPSNRIPVRSSSNGYGAASASERNPGNRIQVRGSSNGYGAASASERNPGNRIQVRSSSNGYGAASPPRIINPNAGPSGPSGRPGTNGVAVAHRPNVRTEEEEQALREAMASASAATAASAAGPNGFASCFAPNYNESSGPSNANHLAAANGPSGDFDLSNTMSGPSAETSSSRNQRRRLNGWNVGNEHDRTNQAAAGPNWVDDESLLRLENFIAYEEICLDEICNAGALEPIIQKDPGMPVRPSWNMKTPQELLDYFLVGEGSKVFPDKALLRRLPWMEDDSIVTGVTIHCPRNVIGALLPIVHDLARINYFSPHMFDIFMEPFAYDLSTDDCDIHHEVPTFIIACMLLFIIAGPNGRFTCKKKCINDFRNDVSEDYWNAIVEPSAQFLTPQGQPPHINEISSADVMQTDAFAFQDEIIARIGNYGVFGRAYFLKEEHKDVERLKGVYYRHAHVLAKLVPGFQGMLLQSRDKFYLTNRDSFAKLVDRQSLVRYVNE